MRRRHGSNDPAAALGVEGRGGGEGRGGEGWAPASSLLEAERGKEERDDLLLPIKRRQRNRLGVGSFFAKENK